MRTLRSIVARITDADPAVRRAAASELSKLRTPAARQALAACLDHRDSEVRRLAAGGLAHFQEASLAPLLLRSARLESEPRTQVALWRAAARTLKAGGRLEDVRRLAALMTDAAFPDDCLSDFCSAGLALVASHPDALPESLISFVTAPEVASSPLIQTALQKAIATMAGQRFARALAPAYLELLQEDAYLSYHAAFIEALGDMREGRAIGTLLEKFENVPALQDKVLSALSLIGVENLDPVMAAAVKLHEEIYFRTPSEEEFVTFFFENAQALSGMGELAVPVLLRLLDHPNGAMRQNARFALEALREPAALMTLLRIADNRRDPEKTRLAWELLRRNHPDLSVKALAADQLKEDA